MPKSGVSQAQALAAQVLGSEGPAQRRAMAKAITLLESSRDDHRAQADELLTALMPHTGKALRLGISGVPGVGKSTFIETLGLHLIGLGHRVAVLAVDPTSSVSGGSILGDKTRMERLSVCEQAFIRPSPSGGTLGGVAEKTREALLVCEAAGYDVVLVETVGVGQSETAVHGMTDLFVLMQLPNAGDELQSIKMGVMELADMVLVNKADLDPAAATRALAQITSTLRLLGQRHALGHEPGHSDACPAVALQLSALRNGGVTEFWQAVQDWHRAALAGGALQRRRQQQSTAWMWERVRAGLQHAFDQHPEVQKQLGTLLPDVQAGHLAPSVAARALLATFLHAS